MRPRPRRNNDMKRISQPINERKAFRRGAVVALFLAVGAFPAPLREAEALNLGDVAVGVAKSMAIRYATHPTLLVRDVKELQALLADFVEKVEKVWGKKDAERPQPKKLVKYTGGYREKAVVDFDAGVMRVETLATGDGEKRLQAAVVAALLTTEEPGAVDLFSDDPIPRQGRPFLHGQVVDHQGRSVDTPEQADRFAAHLIRTGLKKRPLDGGGRALYVEIPLTPGHGEVRAARVRALVEKYADEYGVSRSLVYAVIKTESDFNPYAVSWVPAFGLMQIVPATGGRDAYKLIHGETGIPSREYLFDPGRNIRMGSAYLHLIQDRFLNGVGDEHSREYLSIAAYNGGIGRVLRCFDPDKGRAVRRINTLAPAEVYAVLREKMPKETRDYLVHVQKHRRLFAG